MNVLFTHKLVKFYICVWHFLCSITMPKTIDTIDSSLAPMSSVLEDPITEEFSQAIIAFSTEFLQDTPSARLTETTSLMAFYSYRYYGVDNICGTLLVTVLKAALSVVSVKNAIFAPVNAYVLLSLIHRGTEGRIDKALGRVLHISPENEEKECRKLIGGICERGERTLDIELAIAAFYSQELDPFMTTKSSFYKCENYPTHSLRSKGGQKAIHRWISINGKMNTTELILEGSGPSGTRVLSLSSALFFQAEWGSPSFCQKIGRTAFYKNPLETIRVQTLYYESICKAGTSSSLAAKWVHLTLEKETFTIMILLPTTMHTLDEVISKLNKATLTEIIKGGDDKLVKIKMPVFRLKATTPLKYIFTHLGLVDLYLGFNAFDGEYYKQMKFTSSFQQNMMFVNEYGTKTDPIEYDIASCGSFAKDAGYEEFEFIANHPFLIFLVDQRNSIPLLMGRVKHPKYPKKKCTIL